MENDFKKILDEIEIKYNRSKAFKTTNSFAYQKELADYVYSLKDCYRSLARVKIPGKKYYIGRIKSMAGKTLKEEATRADVKKLNWILAHMPRLLNSFLFFVIPAKLRKKRVEIKHNSEIMKRIKNCGAGEKRIFIFNVPVHMNLGDHALAIAQHEFINNEIKKPVSVVEVTGLDLEHSFSFLKKRVQPDDIIAFNAGGYMGTQWFADEYCIRKTIEAFPDNRIVIFPQTMFYKDDERGAAELENAVRIYGKHKNLHIAAREGLSFELMKRAFPSAEILLCPDMALYFEPKDYKFERYGVLLCLRRDTEQKLSNDDRELIENAARNYSESVKYTDTCLGENIELDRRNAAFEEKLKEFAHAELIITDRLHGMLFSFITKTPCVVFGNNNHKVKGVYEWIKDCRFVELAQAVENIEPAIDKVLTAVQTEQDTQEINMAFGRLADMLIGESSEN